MQVLIQDVLHKNFLYISCYFLPLPQQLWELAGFRGIFEETCSSEQNLQKLLRAASARPSPLLLPGCHWSVIRVSKETVLYLITKIPGFICPCSLA